MRTLPARQQERAKPWHPVDAGLSVAKRVAMRQLNRTVPPATGHCRRRYLFGNLGSCPCFGVVGNLGRAAESLPSRRGTKESLLSPSTVMSLLSMAVVAEERRAFWRRFQRAKKDGGEYGPVWEFLGGQTPIHMGVSLSNSLCLLTCSPNWGCSRSF